MQQRATYAGSREDLRAALRLLPRLMSGISADPWGIVHGLQLRLGVALLSKIQQDFIRKARGGVGEDGIKWPPLKRATIAQRRTTREERKSLGIGGKRVRGLLTPAQDRRWRLLFARTKAQMQAKFRLGDGEASARAAQVAWTVLKSEGAKTKLDVLGGRQVDQLRDTGELFRSLSPGVQDRPSGADGQVFKTPPGKVIVGTNKKPWHHLSGKRPFWPKDGNLPTAWWDALLGTLQRGLLVALTNVVRRGAK